MTHRTAARVVGILFIVATVAFSLSVLFLEPVLENRDYLASIASNGWGLVAAALILTARILEMSGLQLASSTVFIMDAPTGLDLADNTRSVTPLRGSIGDHGA